MPLEAEKLLTESTGSYLLLSCDLKRTEQHQFENDWILVSETKQAKQFQVAERRQRRQLSSFSRLSYGVGHVLNDLCASMWYSNLLIYFQNIIKFSSVQAGVLLLIGQVADGVATPILGLEMDKMRYFKFGKRKIWHLGGCIAVVLSFPFIFNLCIGCQDSSDWALFIYYVPFILIFTVGWSSTQISHLSLIPDLASNTDEKVLLNAIRFAIISTAFLHCLVNNFALFLDNLASSICRCYIMLH